MKLWWLWHNFSDIFLHLNYNIFTLLQQMLCLGCRNSWPCSTLSSPYVLLTQINTNIVARSVPFIFTFYLHWDFIYVGWTWGSFHSLDTLVFSVRLRSVIHSTHPCVLFTLPIWLPWSTSFVQLSVSKNRSGYTWVWRFRLLDPFCALKKSRNCYLMLFVYLLVWRNS